MKISVYIITKNEEKRLPLTLQAVAKVADEIIVVDSGSTDRTEEIAKRYNAKFIFNKWKNISAQKRFASFQCENEWLLSLDTDEVLSPELIEEINALKANPTADAYQIYIRDMYPGDKKPRRFAKSYNLIRLYNKNAGEMPDDLTHDRIVMNENTTVQQLKAPVHHYSYLNIEHTVYKLNKSSTELVQTANATGRRYSLFRLFFEFPFQFFRYYFLKRYIFAGVYGFILATIYAFERFLKIAKCIEKQRYENYIENQQPKD